MACSKSWEPYRNGRADAGMALEVYFSAVKIGAAFDQ
jgi:hypothetical protein